MKAFDGALFGGKGDLSDPMKISADTPNGGADHPAQRLVEGDLTGKIIGAFYAVYNELRFGFLESVYCASLELEFRERGIAFEREFPLSVTYHGRVVGMYRADFFVGGKVVVEVKATIELNDAHRRQLRHYLKATNTEVGLLLHFGQKANFYRMINTQETRSV